MGSSYRRALKRGDMPELETKILKAACLLREAQIDVHRLAAEEDQYDNAADCGGLAEVLGLAAELIERECSRRASDQQDPAR